MARHFPPLMPPYLTLLLVLNSEIFDKEGKLSIAKMLNVCDCHQSRTKYNQNLNANINKKMKAVQLCSTVWGQPGSLQARQPIFEGRVTSCSWYRLWLIDPRKCHRCDRKIVPQNLLTSSLPQVCSSILLAFEFCLVLRQMHPIFQVKKYPHFPACCPGISPLCYESLNANLRLVLLTRSSKWKPNA
jgi:hypothetical protein